METTELILCVSPPCGGKSTWSKEFTKNNPDYIRICRDDMRLMFNQKQMLDWIGEDILTEMIDEMVFTALTRGKSVILDQTNCKLKYLMKWDTLEYPVKIKLFDESLDVLLERNSKRTVDKVPEQVIRHMYESLQNMKTHPEFKKYKQI